MGARTAIATRATPAMRTGCRAMGSARLPHVAALLGTERRLKLLQECHAPGGLHDAVEQILADRYRAKDVANSRAHRRSRIVALHVIAQRKEIGLASENLLAALRQQIVQEKLGRVWIFRRRRDECHA